MDEKTIISNLTSKIISDIDACCRQVVLLSGKYNKEIHQILTSDTEFLPMFVNVETPEAKILISSILGGKRLVDYQPFIEALHEVVLFKQDRSDIKTNDGKLMALAGMANMLGMHEECERANSAVYSSY